MKKTSFNIPAAILIFLILYVIMLGVRPLFAPDEYRYIEIPREMLADHDYVTPRLNGVRYFEKPIMGYWLIAGALKIFGQNAFGGRFAPAASTGLAALIVLLLAAKMTGRRETAWFAAGCFLLMPLVYFVGTTCTLDAIFSLFVTATVAAFYFAMEAYQAKKRRDCVLWLLATGVAAGCAFLTKGFLAFALPVMAVLPWLVWDCIDAILEPRRTKSTPEQSNEPGRKKDIASEFWKLLKAVFTLPWLPFVVALIVIAPWAILIHRAQPDFWRYFVIEEHFTRFFGGEEAEHAQGPFFFVLTLLWGAAEWFLLAPAIGLGLWKIGVRGKDKSWFRFLICWFAGPFLFLSASSGKLPTYILPCFPALAIMISAALFRHFESRPNEKFRLFNIPLMVFIGVAALASPLILGVICFGLPGSLELEVYGKDETWKLFVMLGTVLLALVGMIASCFGKKPERKLTFFLAVATVFQFATFLIIPQSVYDVRSPGKFLEECRDEITPDTLLISRGTDFHAVCCLYERNDVYLLSPGEETYGMGYPEDMHRELLYGGGRKDGEPRIGLQQFLKENPGRKVMMFFPADHFYRIRLSSKSFPDPVSVKKSIESDPETKEARGYVMVRFQ